MSSPETVYVYVTECQTKDQVSARTCTKTSHQYTPHVKVHVHVRHTYNVAGTIKMLCLPFIFVLHVHVAGAAEAAQKWSGSYYGGQTVAVCFVCSVEKF